MNEDVNHCLKTGVMRVPDLYLQMNTRTPYIMEQLRTCHRRQKMHSDEPDGTTDYSAEESDGSTMQLYVSQVRGKNTNWLATLSVKKGKHMGYTILCLPPNQAKTRES